MENIPTTIGALNRAEDNAVRKRKPAMKWKRFWNIPVSGSFYIGRYLAVKTGLFSYAISTVSTHACGHVFRYTWPWTKFRICEPVKKFKPSEWVGETKADKLFGPGKPTIEAPAD